MFYIYKFTNKINGKSYIGKTRNFTRRLVEHRSRVKSGSGYHFHNALRKYGEDSFICEIIWKGESEQDSFSNEIFFIEKFKTFENGYNMTRGGDSGPSAKGRVLSEETKRKISNSNKGVSRNSGIRNSGTRTKSEAHRKAIGDAHRGRVHNYKNGRTRTWSIIFPDGSINNIENLQQFEKELGLKTNSIRNTKRTKKPHYSGYMIKEE